MNVRPEAALPMRTTGGKYQWNAIVGCKNSRGEATKQNITVFSDDRSEAIADACAVAAQYGYRDCTLNHITKIGRR